MRTFVGHVNYYTPVGGAETKLMPDRILYTPIGKYDLVLVTGLLYNQYDHRAIAKMATDAASKHVCIGGIVDWLRPYVFGELIRSFEFPYREYLSAFKVYETRP